MKKIIYYLFGMILFIPIFVYADTINIDLSCPEKISNFVTIKCDLNVNSDFDVSSLKMKVFDSSISKCSFTNNDSKTIEIGDDQILTINGISSGNNKIGEITVMSSINDEPKKNKTITISDIVATKSDGTEVRGIDVSKNVYVQSVDNSLKNLEVTGLTFEFDRFKNEYNIEAPESLNSVEIKATPNDSDAEVTGTGIKTLKPGTNTFKITVKAENRNLIKSYIINIKKPGETVVEKPTGKGYNYLTKFVFLGYDYGFDKNKTDYLIIVDNKVTKFAECSDNADRDDYLCLIDSAVSGDLDNDMKMVMLFNDVDILKAMEENNNIKVKDNELGGHDGYLDGELIWKTDKTGRLVYNATPFANINVGENILKVIVKADNEKDRIYTFKIVRKDAEGNAPVGEKNKDNDVMPPETGNTIYVVICMILVISFGVGMYFFYKKTAIIEE